MVTPILSIRGSAHAIAFYREAFNAVEIMRMDGPNGPIVQAEIPLGDNPVAGPLDWAKLSAGPLRAPLTIPVADVENAVATTVNYGGKVLRDSLIQDPFGQVWRLKPTQ